jgi:hypothetical protein
MENMVNESKYGSRVKTIRKDAENLLGIASQLVGAVGGNELDQMVSGALDAASNLIAFADYFLDDGTVTVDAVRGNYAKVLNAARNLKTVQTLNTNESTEIFVDPYEAEYLPSDMLSGVKVQEMTESINEDNDPLPDDLDDDPDAVFTTNVDGTPVKFNNTPIDVDPFAVKLFRNNSELVDPPEVFNAEQGTDAVDAVVDIPVEMPAVTPDVVKDIETTVDTMIDAVADSEPESTVQQEKANESRVIPKDGSNVLPPQFKDVAEIKEANERIADDTSHNLKLLSFLAGDMGW